MKLRLVPLFSSHVIVTADVIPSCTPVVFIRVNRPRKYRCCSAGEKEELAKLVERLEKASTAHGMDSIAEKRKLMANNISGISKENKKGQKLETVTSFKYLQLHLTLRVPSPRYSPG